MNANLLDWNDLAWLADVARSGSLLAAARGGGVAVSTLSRRMTALEEKLGVTLLERGPRGVLLTPSALALSTLGGELRTRIEGALRALPRPGEPLRGTVRISAGDGFAELLSEICAGLSRSHSELRFELELQEKPVDLARRAADIALRTVHRQEASLRYQKIGELSYGVFAAPQLLARLDPIRSVRDLKRVPVVSLAAPLDRLPAQRWLNERATVVATVSTFQGQLGAVRAGLGAAALPELGASGLERLPSARDLPSLPVWLVTRAGTRREPHVHAVARALAQQLTERLGA